MAGPGVLLIWTAAQVSAVAAAALLLQSLGSRRGPSGDARASAVGLALVVLVSLLAPAPPLAPRPEGLGRPTLDSSPAVRSIAASVAPAAREAPGLPAASGAKGWTWGDLRAAGGRLGRRAVAPSRRFRPLGDLAAALALAGAGFGLARLALGLWAVADCRRRGRPVADADLLGMLADLRGAMGCRRPVELRELDALAVPATAGWLRPLILLPEAWRGWALDERRAVLAHELAHVRAGDYATGLVARLAVALHFYHPLVRRLAARLDLQQELAADALAARFAGGRRCYLRSLSRLALAIGRAGPPPRWPARAFLPAPDTLIRRIAMLQVDSKDRTPSPLGRGLATLALVAVAALAASFRAPALAGGDAPAPPTPSTVPAQAAPKPAAADPLPPPLDPGFPPFDLSIFPDDAPGLVAARPAAFFRAEGMAGRRFALNVLIAQQWASLAQRRGVDLASVPRPLRVEMFEQVATDLAIAWDDKRGQGSLVFETMVMLRTNEPVDWPALLRAWKVELVEVVDGDRTYYRMLNTLMGKDAVVYSPDDRTLVVSFEPRLLKALHRPPGSLPDLARNQAMNRLLRGLVLVALDNRDGHLATALAKGFPEVGPLFDRPERWTLGVDGGADGLALAIEATCPDDPSAARTAAAAGRLLEGGRLAAKDFLAGGGKPKGEIGELARRVAGDLLRGLTVRQDGRSVAVRASGFGRIADLAAMVAAEFGR